MFKFITVLLICILAGMEVDLFIPSFPELQRVFNLTPFQVQLTLSVNFIAYCVCCLFAGTLGDRFNRRTVLLGSLAIFVFGSILCVTALSFAMLLAGRCLQGIGMAGPAVLAFVVIADEYPIEKQPAMLGILNGMITVAMAFAPVIGSHVNLYFDWRGNFIVLLGLSIVCLVTGFLAIPNRKGDPSVSLSPKTYVPLLNSKRFMYFVLAICLMCTPYWVFIGMAPILYMEDLGVSLQAFGFYQGAIAGVFSVVSLLSSILLLRFKEKRCFYVGTTICGISAILILIITIFGLEKPWILTGAMLVLAAGIVFPINILYPQSLEVVENVKGRAAAVVGSTRLIMTAGGLGLVSYIYKGSYFPIGILSVVTIVLAILVIYGMAKKDWITLSSNAKNVNADNSNA